MDIAKINIIVYRLVGIIICGFLFLGSIGMFLYAYYLKGGIGIASGIIIGWYLFKLPSIKTWATILIVLLVALFLVGYLPTPK
ncbi:MAG: hypothetical protein V4560_02535 [Bacteroidota bacterium]